MAHIDGWIAYGASKRGMVSWLIGASQCEKEFCPKIKGVVPIVPLEPNLNDGVHHQWRAYGAFSWAFGPYAAEELTTTWDGDVWQEAYKIGEPLSYLDRYEKIPKLVIVSSNDEFMMMEWTANWWDKMTGEKYLLINDNTEHTEATGVVKVANAVAWFINRIKDGETYNYNFTHELKDDKVTVTLEEETERPVEVGLRYAQTTQGKMRDFRWVILGDHENPDHPCTFPNFQIPGKKGPNGVNLCF